jgi:multicomponent Na+:H+ antiporter subunit C
MTWVLILVLFFLGVWGMIRKQKLIKKVIAMNISSAAGVILFVYMGSLSGKSAPILIGEQTTSIVDPLPQALMLTAIVVGVCTTAFSLALVYRIFRHYGTVDIGVIEKTPDKPEGSGTDE